MVIDIDLSYMEANTEESLFAWVGIEEMEEGELVLGEEKGADGKDKTEVNGRLLALDRGW